MVLLGVLKISPALNITTPFVKESRWNLQVIYSGFWMQMNYEVTRSPSFEMSFLQSWNDTEVFCIRVSKTHTHTEHDFWWKTVQKCSQHLGMFLEAHKWLHCNVVFWWRKLYIPIISDQFISIMHFQKLLLL